MADTLILLLLSIAFGYVVGFILGEAASGADLGRRR